MTSGLACGVLRLQGLGLCRCTTHQLWHHLPSQGGRTLPKTTAAVTIRWTGPFIAQSVVRTPRLPRRYCGSEPPTIFSRALAFDYVLSPFSVLFRVL